MKKIITSIMFSAFIISFGISATYARSVAPNVADLDASNSSAISEDKAKNIICAQVITPAVSPDGECKSFSTPCDVPGDWKKTDECETAEKEINKETNKEINKEIKKEKNEKVIENNNQLKNNFQNSKDNYSDAKEKLLQERSKVKDADKEKLRKSSSEFLNKTVSVMIKYLESLKNKVENTNFVSDDNKNLMIVQLDNDISALNLKLEVINNEETTLEEQKNIAAEIRRQWKDIRSASKKITGQMLSIKMNSFISKMETLRDRLREKNGEANGEIIQGIINNFSAKIELAKSESTLAQEKFAQINSAGQADNSFGKGMQHLRNTHKHIKEAHKELLSLSAEIKKNRKNNEDGANKNPEDSTEEVEETNETE